jgi:predicted tellurium resistance membrane protein TerC
MAIRRVSSFPSAVGQILVLDVVFSLDSVITAIGMSNRIGVMIAAIVLAIIFMLVLSGQLSRFIDAHPTVKVLALAFLILIGVNLIAEGFHQQIPKGYTYFALAFSIGVEMLNLRMRSKAPSAEEPESPQPTELAC